VIVNCNWKVAVIQYFEQHHIPVAHPAIAAASNDLQSQYDYFGLHSRMLGVSGVASLATHGRFTEKDTFETHLKYFQGIDDPAAEASAFEPINNARRALGSWMRKRHGDAADIAETSDAELIDSILYFIFPNFM